MSSLSERPLRSRVLRGPEVHAAAADLDTVSARPARALVVSNELVESARQEGYQTGYDAAFERGYQDGIAQARQHVELLAGLVQRLGQAADDLLARETTAREQLEDDVVNTAFVIAEAIVGHEIEQPDRRGRDAVARALGLAPATGLVVARVSPIDLAVMGDAPEIASGRGLELVADDSLTPGDCIVDVGSCRIDARVDLAVERVREVLA